MERLSATAGFPTSAPSHFERLPTGEVEIAGESPHVIEEGFSGGQSGAQEAVVLVGKFQDGVEEEGQDVQNGQEQGKMSLAVAEIMFLMIALGFEGVVVLVLDLPAGAARSG